MNKQQPTQQQRIAREKALHRYMDAFERGDFERMAQVLAQAEQDPELEDLIWKVHAAYVAEEELERQENDIELVQQLLRRHLPSGWETLPDIESIPPLTVGDVVARLQADEATKGSVKQEFNIVVQRLRQSTLPLPQNLGIQSIRTLFSQLGVQASKQLQKLFSETALFLSAGREQGMAHLAATRRQQEQSSTPRIQDKQEGQENQTEEEEQH
jgi:hypothetical protein